LRKLLFFAALDSCAFSLSHNPPEIRLHFRFAKIDVLPPSSWRQAALIRAAFYFSNLRQQKTPMPKGIGVFW
jgi:hypothetical protein